MNRSKLAALAALLAIGLSAPVGAQDKIAFRLDWSLQGTHSPWFLASEKGYFKAEGLDVTILEGQGSATVVKLVASGSAEPIGFADYATMMKGVAQGLPVKAVFGINQTSPMIIMSRADNPVKTPKDLEGKIVAMAPAESTAQVYPALIASAKIDGTKVSVLNPAVGAKMALLLQGKIDAMTAGLNGQVPQVEARGVKVEYFKYADYGVNTLNNGIIVNAQFLSDKAELVRRFLRAQAKGWADARKNPAESIAALLKAKPELAAEKAVLTRQLELTFETLETPNTKGKPLGWMSDADWEQTQALLKQYADLTTTRPVQDYYTNDFVPR
ncbi:MAG: ABC transporter substrate-binding protein [Alphaproteobacteria bacterium]|nr:ABC transporter substrate-binding protein [Alphaproteobacteria bacterium]